MSSSASPGLGSRLNDAAKPAWNTDPSVHKHPLQHRTQVYAPSYDIELEVAERFVPRRLFPVMEDLKYKENTRRHALVTEWRRQLHSIRLTMRQQHLVAAEDEARVVLMTDYAREMRVLRHWVRGRVVFAEGCIDLEQTETKQRQAIAEEAATESAQQLKPQAATVSLMASQETGRRTIEEERQAGLDHMSAAMEAEVTEMAAGELFRVEGNRGIAVALAAWALEGVMSPQAALDLAPAGATRSLFVQERYVMFGLPASFKPSTSTSTAGTSSKRRTPHDTPSKSSS